MFRFIRFEPFVPYCITYMIRGKEIMKIDVIWEKKNSVFQLTQFYRENTFKSAKEIDVYMRADCVKFINFL